MTVNMSDDFQPSSAEISAAVAALHARPALHGTPDYILHLIADSVLHAAARVRVQRADKMIKEEMR